MRCPREASPISPIGSKPLSTGTALALVNSHARAVLEETRMNLPACPNSNRCSVLERLAQLFTNWTGSSWAFTIAVLTILAWAVTGPLFGFSDTWQLVINTGTTIVTFLMVFLIQRSQNKEALAVQLKLNEIIAALHGASNRLINVEDLGEAEIKALHQQYQRLAKLLESETRTHQSHSIDDLPHHPQHSNGAGAAPRAS